MKYTISPIAVGSWSTTDKVNGCVQCGGFVENNHVNPLLNLHTTVIAPRSKKETEVRFSIHVECLRAIVNYPERKRDEARKRSAGKTTRS